MFYKTWHDNYVSETLNQRPDIYLTLYRAVLDEDGNLSKPEAVPGYIHFSWSALAESTDAANEQMVTISGLSKYDSNGANISIMQAKACQLTANPSDTETFSLITAASRQQMQTRHRHAGCPGSR